MCIYNTGSRTGLIDSLREMRGELAPEETELRELTDSALGTVSYTHLNGKMLFNIKKPLPLQETVFCFQSGQVIAAILSIA